MLRNKTLIAGLTALTLGVAGAAIADGQIVGTIKATKAQRAEWTSMAKITMDEAKAIALRDTPGTIDDADLDTEDGYLVYEIDIDDSKGGEHELVIDAGSGSILSKTSDK